MTRLLRHEWSDMEHHAKVEDAGYPMLDEQDWVFAKLNLIDLEDGAPVMWAMHEGNLPNYLCMAEQLYAEKVGYV